MPKKKSGDPTLPPALALKLLILSDDPLVREHGRLVDELHPPGPRIREEDPHPVVRYQSEGKLRLLSKLEALAEQICRKYKIADIDGRYPILEKDWASRLAKQYHLGDIVRISTNWRSSFSPNIPAETVIPKDPVNAFRKLFCPSPLNPSPIMTLEVDLSRVKRKNLAPLVTEFTRAIRQGLDELPRSLRKLPDMWTQNLARDYTRFRLHFNQGMPFRWIAYREKTGKAPSGRLSGPVPTESSVRESVERVHLIVFEKKYSARLHKAALREAPLQRACDEFNCLQHGRECPQTCTHAKELMKKIDLLLK